MKQMGVDSTPFNSGFETSFEHLKDAGCKTRLEELFGAILKKGRGVIVVC